MKGLQGRVQCRTCEGRTRTLGAGTIHSYPLPMLQTQALTVLVNYFVGLWFLTDLGVSISDGTSREYTHFRTGNIK